MITSGALFDSGASGHMTGDLSLLVGPRREICVGVTGVAGSLSTKYVASGSITINGSTLLLSELFYVPGLSRTLLSISRLVDDGVTITATLVDGVNCLSFTKDGSLLFRVPAVAGLYSSSSVLSFPPTTTATSGGSCFVGVGLADLLHRRCGHISWSNRRWAKRLREVYGANVGEGCSNVNCEACMRAKMHQVISRLPPSRPASRPLERIMFDLSPSVPVSGVDGHTGFLLIVDEFTRYWTLHCVFAKSEVADLVKHFRLLAEKHFSSSVGVLCQLTSMRSDGESVNVCRSIREWCSSEGVSHEISAPYSQWQNGIAERAIGVAWEGGEAMRKEAGAPSCFWPFSLQAFFYTRNRLSLGSDERSPYEKWWQTDIPLKRRVDGLRVWGCKCFAYVPKSIRRKLDDKARVCVFLGYSLQTRGYILMDLDDRRVFTAVSVRFDESSYPFKDDASFRASFSSSDFGDIPLTWPLLSDSLDSAPDPRDRGVNEVGDVDDAHVPDNADVGDAGVADVLQAPVIDAVVDNGVDSGSVPSSPISASSVPPASSSFGGASDVISLGGADGMMDSDSLFEVEDIVDFRLSPFGDLDDPSTSGPVEQFRVRWAGCGPEDDSWEPRSSLVHAPDVLDSAERRFANKISRLRARSCVPRSRSRSDWLTSGDLGGTSPPPSPEPPPEPPPSSPPKPLSSDPPAPPPPGSSSSSVEWLTSDDIGVTPPSVLPSPPESRSVGSRSPDTWFTANDLSASLASIDITSYTGHRPVVDQSGEVHVPPVVLAAADKLVVSRMIDDCALDPATVTDIRRRIELIALAATASDTAPFTYVEPRNYYEAMRDINASSWFRAMEEEMQNMHDFGVWELVPAPKDANIMSCRWVFKVKRNVNGGVDKLKARLTCRGFTQRAGIDFDDTWAPTCRMRVFRMMMAEASSDSSIRTAQWDCTAAFLHAPVDHVMYMRQAPGFARGGPGMVYRLKKAIYGCRQSSALFHKVVRDALLGLGAVQAAADECLFILREASGWAKILVHCDDFAITYNDRSLYDDLFAAMRARFKITDYGGGPIRRFVGVCVERTPEGYYRLHQLPYIEEILSRLHLSNCKHARSPERPGTAGKLRLRSLSPAEMEYMATVPYREAVGALFYVSRCTRFDIAHAVSEVARFMGSPAPEHWDAVLRIYRYLARTKDVALRMHSRGMQCELTDQLLEGFSDSDWAGCPDTRRSHTGWLVRIGGSLVSWYSKRQSCIAQSTTEAEYIAAAAIANELVWWKLLCKDFGYTSSGPISIWCDNRAATTLSDHAGNFDAAKHIEVRYHVVRRYQRLGIIKVCWRRSCTMWADVLTKNCSYPHFETVVSKLLGENLTPA